MVRQGVRSGTTEAVLPGMILNTSKETCHLNVETEQEEHAHAGRLECTMQNLADCFAAPVNEDTDCSDLPTFLVYGPRRKVTSSAKRKRKPGSLKIHQTPDGSFYDLQQNAKAMLELCGMDMPDVGSVEKYLETGPGFVFLFHPALGPLWHVVAQKIKGGKMHERAEVQLEVAEASIVDLEVSGSLIVSATPLWEHMWMEDCTIVELHAPEYVWKMLKLTTRELIMKTHTMSTGDIESSGKNPARSC
eukprot:jgi/Picre1/35715/NNA_003175.t1